MTQVLVIRQWDDRVDFHLCPKGEEDDQNYWEFVLEVGDEHSSSAREMCVESMTKLAEVLGVTEVKVYYL